MVSSVIAGSPASIERHKIEWEYLKSQYDQNPEKFSKEWVSFRMEGEDAAKEVSWLVADYCALHGHAKVSDPRDIFAVIEDDYAGVSRSYPLGKVFGLAYDSWWIRLWEGISGKSRKTTMMLYIRPEQVVLLQGNLEKFSVWTKESMILFSKKGVALLPMNSSTAE